MRVFRAIALTQNERLHDELKIIDGNQDIYLA